jgi:hypothetical protein
MLSGASRLDVCRQLLAYSAMVLKNGDDQELMSCVAFLNIFVHESEVGTEVIYNDTNLRGALYGYLEGRFAQSSCDTQHRALRTVAKVVDMVESGGSDYGIFLRSGAFQAVKCAAVHVFSCALVEEEPEISRMKEAMMAFQTTLYIVLCFPSLLVHLDADMYRLSRKDMRHITVTVYNLLSSFWAESRLCDVTLFLLEYGNYLEGVCGLDALQSFLLYKPPRDAEAKPIALLWAECAMNCGEASREDQIMRALWRYSLDFPQVGDILSWLPSPPVRIEKDRHCALARCEVKGEGMYNNLKKCGRCMAVYYCCKGHQLEHWSEHRLTCAKAGEAVTILAR